MNKDFSRLPRPEILTITLAIIVLIGGFLLVSLKNQNHSQDLVYDYKNAEYVIKGERVRLRNGIAETELMPGGASKVVTRYFGNELKTDLNNDGREDMVFIVTQETGGSGTFFYVVAALSTDHGYIGSDGYFLGDRIAPQSIDISPNPRHKNVLVVNYADRAPQEPMTAKPSIGKSAYLKFNVERMQWGIVLPDFEGESR